MTDAFFRAKRSRSASLGFTLIEIMVAIAILGLVGVTLLTGANSSTRDIGVMQKKMEALSIAEFTLNTVLIEKDMPAVGQQEQFLERANRRWLVKITVSETLNEKVLRVDVQVTAGSDINSESEQATILLSGFKTDIEPG